MADLGICKGGFKKYGVEKFLGCHAHFRAGDPLQSARDYSMNIKVNKETL